MALNEKLGPPPWIIDERLPAEHFFCDADGIFHIGPGTDIHAALFVLRLTEADIEWLHHLKIATNR